MKIGILAQYLETRPDISELINRLAQSNEVIVFQADGDKPCAYLGSRVQLRHFKRQLGWLHKLWFLLFKMFGKIPVSRHNYFITEDFKIQNSASYGSNLRTWRNQLILWINYHVPAFISYDAYVQQMASSVSMKVDDIDVFICYTQIYDDGFFGKLLQEKKKIFVLVYSWDHPCKMKCFSKNEVHYLVWNHNIENDLVTLQGIDSKRISIVGTSQFGYLNRYLTEPATMPSGPPYFYFAFSTGTPSLALQEIEVVQKIASILASQFPGVVLRLRPYPFFKGKAMYEPLKQLANVEFEAETEAADVYGKMKHKYTQMAGSKGFLHFGTTLGVEACFLPAPVIFLSLKEEKLKHALYYFIHQYQNDAYLHQPGFSGTVESYSQLNQSFSSILSGSAEPIRYNRRVLENFVCSSFDDYAARVEQVFSGNG